MAIDTQQGKPYSPTRSRRHWWGYLYLVLLLAAAAVLLVANLGIAPIDGLREGYFIQIAKEIIKAPEDSWRWLFPTFAGKPLVFQAPLYPNLLALAYKVAGESTWTARLPGAGLIVLSLFAVYGIGRELFRFTLPTILVCCLYLTFFPVVNLARLATIDGALLSFELLAIWGFLRSRRDLRWSVVTGIGLSLIGLTHTWSLLPVLAIMLLFLAWDTPRLLVSFYFWSGLLLGLAPLLAWYLVHWYFYEPDWSWSLVRNWRDALVLNPRISWDWLLNRPFNRYIAFVLTCTSPVLAIAVSGIKLAWKRRNWSWGKFALVAGTVGLIWAAIGFIEGFILSDTPFDRWCLLPLYFVMALLAGARLYRLYNTPRYVPYPPAWGSFLGYSALGFLLLALYGKLSLQVHFGWLGIAFFSSVLMTHAVSGYLLVRRDPQLIAVSLWGNYVSLLLFFCVQNKLF